MVKDGNGGGVGNNNGIADAGEEIDLDVQLINTGNSTATNVSATLSTNDPDINITDDYESWTNIPAGSLEWEDDFDFEISSNSPTKTVTFYLQITSDQGSWNDSFTINIQGQSGGNNPISITPSNSCSSAPVIQVNTEYEVNIDVGDYGLYTPTGGESYQGDDIRGFWIELDVPSNWSGNHLIAITDVSGNFDPVISLKGVCSSSFYLYQPNTSFNYGNFGGLGESEAFVFNANASINYYIRIYHYYGYQTPNISFKIIVE